MTDLGDRVDTYLLSEWDLITLLISTANTLRIAPGYALLINGNTVQRPRLGRAWPCHSGCHRTGYGLQPFISATALHTSFQDAQIEQLSPGQRGALLLIFYLLVDKRRNPIILDQPEENLDNETVVSLLVPVLSEAKRKRQIIMATHNSSFDRKNASTITYVSGAIENPKINKHVVDVLEGTMPAFQNRREVSGTSRKIGIGVSDELCQAKHRSQQLR
jgi:hypothetical protein